jgi:hypothetical protein
MNIDQAILAHVKWKIRLKRYIDGHEEVDPAILAKDDQCDLGKWLYADAKDFVGPVALADLKTRHARFHTVAAGVARSARSLSPGKAMEMLDPLDSEFGRASSDCVNALAALRDSAAAAAR